MVYGHAIGEDIEVTVEEVGRYIDMGDGPVRARTGFHGATDISAVMMAAALHFGLRGPNSGAPETDEVFPQASCFEDGHLHPGHKRGLGVDPDGELAAPYP